MLQLITILNRCHRFPGFVYQQAGFSSDHKSIEIAVRPRKGSAAVCSRCHQSAPGYDQLPERRFEFIPFWGFLVWQRSELNLSWAKPQWFADGRSLFIHPGTGKMIQWDIQTGNPQFLLNSESLSPYGGGNLYRPGVVMAPDGR